MLFRYLPLFIFLLTSCHNKETQKKDITLPKPKGKDSVTYQQFLSSIDSSRLLFKSKYSTNPKEIKQVKDYFIQIIGSDLYSYWQGTPWDYNGTTTIPQKGKIACGYFVTTVLKDAGIKLNRYKLAVCPSFTMMEELTSKKDIKNLSSLNYSEFADWLHQYGKSVFIIGLDYHTGFIVNDGKECWFIHSNYIYKIGVIKEKITESNALKASKTRYITCLTDNEKFLRNWLFH